MNRHTLTFTALPEHIDELGHVNNAVWVDWIQQIATAHWGAVASPEHQATYIWVVTRHEIDYRGNIALGESVRGETFIPSAPSGARLVVSYFFCARSKIGYSCQSDHCTGFGLIFYISYSDFNSLI